MLTALLADAFRRFGAGRDSSESGSGTPEQGRLLGQAIEHVVDETYSRLRVLPGYAERLREPVRRAFAYIDGLVEAMPEPLLCSRSRYVTDPQLNAFFGSADQIQEVFSQSEAVRDLFDAHPEASECWALLCMRREERQHMGLALVGEEVRREVLQTGVSFGHHQVMSPGVDEDDARHALKCCIFGSLLGYIRRRVKHDKEQVADLQSQRAQLQVQLKQTDSGVQAEGLEARIDAIERELASLNQPLATLEDYLGFVAEVVSGPENFIRSSADQLRLTRMGVKLTDGSSESGYMVPVVEIHVACHEPRVATLVRFPRAELLPRPDYLAQADLFLAV